MDIEANATRLAGARHGAVAGTPVPAPLRGLRVKFPIDTQNAPILCLSCTRQMRGTASLHREVLPVAVGPGNRDQRPHSEQVELKHRGRTRGAGRSSQAQPNLTLPPCHQ